MHPFRVAAFAILCALLLVVSEVKAATLPLAPMTAATDWSFERFMRGAVGAVDAVDSHTVDIGGKAVKMTGTRSLSNAALARGIARGAAGGVAGVAVALALEAAYCKYTSGTYTCDPLQDKTPETVVLWGFCNYSSNCYTHKSIPAAFAARRGGPPAAGYITPEIVSVGTPSTPTTCFISGVGSFTGCRAVTVTFRSGPTVSPSTSTESYQAVSGVEYACPAAPLAGPGYAERGGSSVLGGDKCPTGVQGAASEGDAPARLGPAITAENNVQIANELKGRIDLAPLAGPQVASGPMSLGGTSTVKTRVTALGEAESVLEWTKTDITYAGNTYTTTTTKTTTVTDTATGEVVSTDTETTTTESAEEGAGLCELFPNIVACAKIDEIEVDPLPEVNRDVTFAPASGFGPDSGSCPPDQTASFLGQAITWSYAPMCQFASGIRFVVIALAALLGGMIVMGAARSES